MGSDDHRCIFIDVQYNVHVYQISDENDFIKILYASQRNLCKQWILSGCYEKQSLVYSYFVIEINKLNEIHVVYTVYMNRLKKLNFILMKYLFIDTIFFSYLIKYCFQMQ